MSSGFTTHTTGGHDAPPPHSSAPRWVTVSLGQATTSAAGQPVRPSWFMRIFLIVGALSITLIGLFLAVVAVVVSIIVLPFVLIYGRLKRAIAGTPPASEVDTHGTSVEGDEGRQNVRVRKC